MAAPSARSRAHARDPTLVTRSLPKSPGGAADGTMGVMSPHYLAPLFAPRSVALIGASEDPAKVGGRMLDNLLSAGFAGKLFAVNPRHASVRGVPCFPNPLALPQAVDLAVIATPADGVAAVLDACGARGIR